METQMTALSLKEEEGRGGGGTATDDSDLQYDEVLTGAFYLYMDAQNGCKWAPDADGLADSSGELFVVELVEDNVDLAHMPLLLCERLLERAFKLRGVLCAVGVFRRRPAGAHPLEADVCRVVARVRLDESPASSPKPLQPDEREDAYGLELWTQDGAWEAFRDARGGASDALCFHSFGRALYRAAERIPRLLPASGTEPYAEHTMRARDYEMLEVSVRRRRLLDVLLSKTPLTEAERVEAGLEGQAVEGPSLSGQAPEVANEDLLAGALLRGVLSALPTTAILCRFGDGLPRANWMRRLGITVRCCSGGRQPLPGRDESLLNAYHWGRLVSAFAACTTFGEPMVWLRVFSQFDPMQKVMQCIVEVYYALQMPPEGGDPSAKAFDPNLLPNSYNPTRDDTLLRSVRTGIWQSVALRCHAKEPHPQPGPPEKWTRENVSCVYRYDKDAPRSLTALVKSIVAQLQARLDALEQEPREVHYIVTLENTVTSVQQLSDVPWASAETLRQTSPSLVVTVPLLIWRA